MLFLKFMSQRISMFQDSRYIYLTSQFKFSINWSCVSLPRHTTSSDCKFMLFLKFMSQRISMFQDSRYIYLTSQFKFSINWSCVSLPRHTTSSDWKCMLFVKFMSQHISRFKPYFTLTTGYKGSKTQNEVDIRALEVNSVHFTAPYKKPEYFFHNL